MLLALSANSPRWRGRDTGFASWRSVHAQRWPVHGVPPYWNDLAHHDRHVAAMLATGSVVDEEQLYWQLRLSSTYPTVEFRVFDVCLDAATAVALAALVCGLVVTSMAEAESQVRGVPTVGEQLLAAASWQAARHGLGDQLVGWHSLVAGDPELRPAADVVRSLLSHVDTALARAGDVDVVHSMLADLLVGHCGAERQRRAWATAGPSGLLDLLATCAAMPVQQETPRGGSRPR